MRTVTGSAIVLYDVGGVAGAIHEKARTMAVSDVASSDQHGRRVARTDP